MLGDMPVSVELVAVGLLERLWHLAVSSAIRGDVGRFDDEEIAEMIGWHGDSSQLIDVFVECGWLDRCDEHRLIIHDWHDHAPRHVKANAKKQGGILRVLRESPNGAKGDTHDLTRPNLTQHNHTEPNTTGDRGGGPVLESGKIVLELSQFRECVPIACRIARVVTGNEQVRTDKLKEPDRRLCLNAAALSLYRFGAPWLEEILLSIQRRTKPPENRWGHFRGALVKASKRVGVDYHDAEKLVEIPQLEGVAT